MDQFLSYMNEEVIFDSFSGIGNIILSDVVCAVSYLHSKDNMYRDTKPANVLVSNFHYKSYKHEESTTTFGKKKLLFVKLVIWRKRDLYIHRLTL